jgi:outer membrane protein TolC
MLPTAVFVKKFGSLVAGAVLAAVIGFSLPAAADTPVSAPAPNASDQSIDQILNSTVSGSQPLPSLTSPEPLPVMQGGAGLSPVFGLPASITDHQKNKTMRLGPLHVGQLIQVAALHPVQLEASFNQTMSLRDCLQYALRNALPIRINYQTLDANRYVLLGQASGFLPSTSTNLSFTNSQIQPSTAVSSRVFTASIVFPVFQGGSVLYGTLSQYYRMHAARSQYNASINDTLLNTNNAYYNLLLQRALLQIDIKAVEVDKEQLRLNEQMYYAGTGTRFAVMQSETQLALDRQTLLQQQVTTRLAVLNLAFTVNMPLGVNIVPVEDTITESDIVDQSLKVNDLLNLSLTHRPELREFEMLRLAAARNVQVQTAPLYPTARWSITYGHTSTTVAGPHTALGGLVSASTSAVASPTPANGVQAPAVGVTTAGIPVLNGTPLPVTQLTPGTALFNGTTVNVTPTTSGAAVLSSPVVPLTQITPGASSAPATSITSSTSGTAAPTPTTSSTNGASVQPTPIIPGTGGLSVTPGTTNTTFGTATSATTTGAGGSTVVTGGSGVLGGASLSSLSAGGTSTSSNGANLPAIGSFGGVFSFVSFQFNLNWTLGNMGAGYTANILSARAASRQSLLQCNQALLEVSQQVRSAYMNMLSTRNQIDAAATGVASSTEELRLANLRLQMGVGTNLELIQAERDYIQALVNQVQAIIASNQAQAQLLHDTGLISTNTLVNGYRRTVGSTGTTH